MSNDTISRQSVIEDIKVNAKDLTDVLIILENFPPADSEWIPVKFRELDGEEKEEHPDWDYILDCPMPEDGQDILVTNGKHVWQDENYIDDGYYLDRWDDWAEITAWMPLPLPYKGENNER